MRFINLAVRTRQDAGIAVTAGLKQQLLHFAMIGRKNSTKRESTNIEKNGFQNYSDL